MELKIANAPCSWGIEFADNPANPPWNQVLDEIAGAGYGATELGPLGYLPTDAESLKQALSERELGLIAGTLFVHLHRPEERDAILEKTRVTCESFVNRRAVSRGHRPCLFTTHRSGGTGGNGHPSFR